MGVFIVELFVFCALRFEACVRNMTLDTRLIYAIRKAHYVQGVPRMVHIRSMKQFNREHYLRDLEQQNWHNVYCSTDHNGMWNIWKENLMT